MPNSKYKHADLSVPPSDPFWQYEPEVNWEPQIALADRENGVQVPDACARFCAYGTCNGSMCGGCCGCRGGCVVEWERQQTAPFLWNGDQA